jgi:hypothetical protein
MGLNPLTDGDNPIRTLHRVRFVGSWVEMWFVGSDQESPEYHACCKGYRLWDLLTPYQVEQVHNTGFRGTIIEFERSGDYNYDPKRMLNPIQVGYLADLSQSK